MFDNDVLGESSAMTGFKCVMVMMAFLVLLALPAINGTLGAEMKIMSSGINSLSTNAVNQQRDHNTMPPGSVPAIAVNTSSSAVRF